MSGHLLIIALGPVQDFIAQARRTRDLWFGSHLLSELSRCAARALVRGGAVLVFPAFKEDAPELAPCPGLLRANGAPPCNVANKLVAEVPEGVAPHDLALRVRGEVGGFWQSMIAERVRVECVALLKEGIDEVWREQVETFIEFQAAWATLEGGYARARERVEEAIAGRKALRDFAPWPRQSRLTGTTAFEGAGQRASGCQCWQAHKSTLDGARETVLKCARCRSQGDPRDSAGVRVGELVRKYRIHRREELDAVGLIKRAGGQPGQFVPVVNVAVASWLEFAEREAKRELDTLREACRAQHPPLSRVERPRLRCARLLGVEAGILFSNRWEPVFRELSSGVGPGAEGGRDVVADAAPGRGGLGNLDGRTSKEAQAWGQKNVAPLHGRLGEPEPYVACLVADGDRMGRAIDEFTSPEEHRAFSSKLADFATRARAVVEQEHPGLLVYAGGDDVLAFLPLPAVLGCADALRRCFTEIMAEACRGRAIVPPTLSVGVGVGHILESMGDLLALGREAEKIAKGSLSGGRGRARNALAVIVEKRSGSRYVWRARWDDWGEQGPVGRLRQDIATWLPSQREGEEPHGLSLLEAATRPPSSGGAPVTLSTDEMSSMPRMSSRKVYEVATVLARLPKTVDEVEGPAWTRVLALEVGRSLARAYAGGESAVAPEKVGLALEAHYRYAALRDEVGDWVNRMLVARAFADAEPRVRDGRESAAAPQVEGPRVQP